MALTTYAELQTALANWLDRTDLTSRAPEFITLAEAKLNRDLRVRPMQSVVSTTMSSSTVALPSDWLKFESIWYESSSTRYELKNVPVQEYNRFDPGSTSVPTGYYIAGSTVYFTPTADSDYTVGYIYYQKIPALTDSNTSNWLLASHPDIYLYGTLLEATPYLKDYPEVPLWLAAFTQTIDQLKKSDRDSKSGVALRARTY